MKRPRRGLALLVFGLVSCAAALPAQAAGPPPGSPTLPKQLQNWASTRSSTMSVLVRDEASGSSWSLNASMRYDNASIVKVNILETVLWQAQRHGRHLTSWERQQAEPMIRQSSNDAATALWNHVGGAAGVQAYDNRLGVGDIRFDSQGRWGLTQSTVTDEVTLLRAVGTGAGPLWPSSRQYVRTQMANVEADQRWGISAGPTTGVQVKNGWLPRPTHGWRVNSIGRVQCAGRDYTIAVLTTDNSSMAYGIASIEGASRIVYRALAP